MIIFFFIFTSYLSLNDFKHKFGMMDVVALPHLSPKPLIVPVFATPLSTAAKEFATALYHYERKIFTSIIFETFETISLTSLGNVPHLYHTTLPI